MRKIIVFNMLSVDGYFAGSDGNIDWHVVDEEFNHFALTLLSRVDTILFGRITYDLFKSYWPSALNDPTTDESNMKIAQAIDAATKIVFSEKELSSDWRNTERKDDVLEKDIRKLKSSDGKDIVIYGSGTIVQQLSNLQLIDEYNLMINPIILGAGKPLFEDIDSLRLKLEETQRYENSGNVLLTYTPQY